MAWAQKKHKVHIETPAERAWVEEKLNASKKWHKPYKGQIVLQSDKCAQQLVRIARYNTREELEADAQAFADEMCRIDTKKWSIASAKLVGIEEAGEDA